MKPNCVKYQKFKSIRNFILGKVHILESAVFLGTIYLLRAIFEEA